MGSVFARLSSDAVAVVVMQCVLLVLEMALCEYASTADASDKRNSQHHSRGGVNKEVEDTIFVRTYAMLMDANVMLFIGFGYLMTFFRRYSFGGTTFSFLLATLFLQWAIIIEGLFEMGRDFRILINLDTLLHADMAATTILISSGVVADRLTPIQLLTMGCMETVAYCITRHFTRTIQVADAGGAVSIHAFAAFYAVAVAKVVRKGRTVEQEQEEEEVDKPNKDFELLGVLVLWVLWPSWHAAWTEADGQQRAVINTILALAAGSTIALTLRSDLPAATLATGVGVGSTCDLMIHPWGAYLIGIISSIISCIRNPWDVHSVLTVHGFPGILAGATGVVLAGLATEQGYYSKLYRHYPAMAPTAPTDTLMASQGLGRQPYQQAGYQAFSVVGTVAIAVLTGSLTGSTAGQGPLKDIPGYVYRK